MGPDHGNLHGIRAGFPADREVGAAVYRSAELVYDGALRETRQQRCADMGDVISRHQTGAEGGRALVNLAYEGVSFLVTDRDSQSAESLAPRACVACLVGAVIPRIAIELCQPAGEE